MSQLELSKKLKPHFEMLSQKLFAKLSPNEDLILNLWAEDTLFVRFNGNRVRQNTNVESVALTMTYQSQGRTVTCSRQIAVETSRDMLALNELLTHCRKNAALLPEDPHQVPVQDNGHSEETFTGSLLPGAELIDAITNPAEGSDLAGLYCGGTVVSANSNSKGQKHWFATEKFFLDYSLYNGPKAAKATYAGRNWSQEDWLKNLSNTRQQLSLLDKPVCEVKPGNYRTYLAPAAASELLTMLSWGALSASLWKQGRCAFKKLADGEAKLSPHFTLKENFELGLTHRFNSRGEVAPETISLIEKGELKEMLVNSRTAKEHGLKSNAAGDWEGLRACDISPGKIEEKDILREIGTGLFLSNLHYLNWSDVVAARVTGMTRYACFWVENGEIVGPINDMRFDESLYEALGDKLVGLTSHTVIDPAVETYGGHPLGGRRTPGILIDDFKFTL